MLKPWNETSRLSKTGTMNAIATVIVMKSRRGQDDSPRRISRERAHHVEDEERRVPDGERDGDPPVLQERREEQHRVAQGEAVLDELVHGHRVQRPEDDGAVQPAVERADRSARAHPVRLRDELRLVRDVEDAQRKNPVSSRMKAYIEPRMTRVGNQDERQVGQVPSACGTEARRPSAGRSSTCAGRPRGWSPRGPRSGSKCLPRPPPLQEAVREVGKEDQDSRQGQEEQIEPLVADPERDSSRGAAMAVDDIRTS